MNKKETVSVVDGIEQAWWEFTDPVYAWSGDQINVTVTAQQGVQEISWDILNSMVLVGVRLDGWPIEVEGDEHVSVAYGSVIRTDERR